MAGNTRFAWITDESIPRSEAEWDQEILRTERFVVVPSVGSLVAGWTLVVPRRAMLNLSHTDPDERHELDAISTLIATQLAHTNAQVYFFEHGSRQVGSLTGCGIDQAHLHIVPLPFDLLEAVRRRADDTVTWRQADTDALSFETLPGKREYIALWSMVDRRPMIGEVRRPVSQWVRRVIADELGIGMEWNYRNHPQRDRIRQTLKMLTPLRTILEL